MTFPFTLCSATKTIKARSKYYTRPSQKMAINHKIHSVTLMRFVWLTECTILYRAFINNLLFGRLRILTPHSSLCDSCSRLMFGDVAWRCNYAWWFNILCNRLTVLPREVPAVLFPGITITNMLIRWHFYNFSYCCSVSQCFKWLNTPQ